MLFANTFSRLYTYNFSNGLFYSHKSESEELQRLEEEQEQLNSSLLALTTHFAQVQFRLKQIVNAEAQDKEVRSCRIQEYCDNAMNFDN